MSWLLSRQVEYQCEGFLEKNRDTVYEEQINILKASQVRTRTTEPENQEQRIRTAKPVAGSTGPTVSQMEELLSAWYSHGMSATSCGADLRSVCYIYSSSNLHSVLFCVLFKGESWLLCDNPFEIRLWGH